ncbi:energy transducer TonB [Luteimonas salinilitoris]|uniref:Energy transducer TonB n=1 Tax=Luteimonas salinilitoris TaxID=3237697 RepID=A0ABV4HS14_9GAMM
MKILATVLLLVSACAASPTGATDVSALAEWTSAVQQRILSNWSRPPGQPETSPRCLICLKISATGVVESAEFKEPCGAAAFEQSVRLAVQRSSPLPLPRDPAVFQRSLVLNFHAR